MGTLSLTDSFHPLVLPLKCQYPSHVLTTYPPLQPELHHCLCYLPHLSSRDPVLLAYTLFLLSLNSCDLCPSWSKTAAHQHSHSSSQGKKASRGWTFQGLDFLPAIRKAVLCVTWRLDEALDIPFSPYYWYLEILYMSTCSVTTSYVPFNTCVGL